MIRIAIIGVSLITICVWLILPDKIWAAWGSSVILTSFQLIAGLVVTEVFVSYGRRRKFKDIAGYKVCHYMNELQVRLYVYANTFSLRSARKELKKMESGLKRLCGSLSEFQKDYQALMDFDTATLVEEIKVLTNRLSSSSNSDRDSDPVFMFYLVSNIDELHKKARKLSKRYGGDYWFLDRDAVIKKWLIEMKSKKISYDSIEPV